MVRTQGTRMSGTESLLRWQPSGKVFVFIGDGRKINMKQRFIHALFVGLLALSCTDEGAIRRKENRAVGIWTFDKVTYKSKSALFGRDVTDLYRGDLITFYADNCAAYDDFDLNETFMGNWGVYGDYEYTGSGDEPVYYLDMSFYDPVADEVFGYYAEIRLLSHHKMKLTAFTDHGFYDFRLIQL
ncbi:MAG: hypothetical protein OEY56_08215 [Cyclobacteriaceae bacterium]|nr:hypothetical protein [Cyclobacteriaceae bacterium]